MTTPFTYDFGYSWSLAWGPVVPAALFGALALLGIWLGWRQWLVIGSSVLTMWSLAALLVMQFTFRINLPLEIPVEQFPARGGRVVDVGAGSGRAAVGLLLARPDTTVTAVDIYDGYWGIDGNTPERMLLNARIAGVAGRAAAQAGDARALPLASGAYDGVISAFAIDHLRRADIPKALAEAGRVLKPGGEFLLMIVDPVWWTWLVSPGIAHHRTADSEQWRRLLEGAGFEVVEQGTQPATLYFLARTHVAKE